MLLTFIAIALGGILKGATGAGAPILAVPVLAVLFDVPFAIAILAVPNLVSNTWQGWHFRRHQIEGRFTAHFAFGGTLGAGFGTYMLARLPDTALLILVSVSVFAYIGFRLTRPDAILRFEIARRLALPVGSVAGMLQGAAGISAPVSITFLNAMRIERAAFVATISCFFAMMSVIQIPMLAHYGFLTWERFAWSCAALVPLFLGMPIGAVLARHLSKVLFDKIVLALLALVAVRLLFQALT
ncbi:sulfite exporter TauE/SafE family protein [Citreimonas salinaria]|uniref:Probable membrane transporter protein n=1 Tax=Citreimonas salinaria TaxID=321339 RepID=A0A1H3KVH8_9RHOB|nr:sulfite exporter TauE/SafE family protein [Citreimonas salinaria]SDY56207.1 hypothetical protein SAMN05444340_110138 [Citreimonas salinaria]